MCPGHGSGGKRRYLRAVRVHPAVVWVIGECLLNGVDCAVDVGFRHSRDLNGHLEDVLSIWYEGCDGGVEDQGGRKLKGVLEGRRRREG